MDCSPPGFSLPGDFPGKNTEMGCHFLLQRIFLTQRWNLCLLHWQVSSFSYLLLLIDNYNIVTVFAIHQYEWATDIHVSPPSWMPLPSPSPPYPSRLSQSTGCGCLAGGFFTTEMITIINTSQLEELWGYFFFFGEDIFKVLNTNNIYNSKKIYIGPKLLLLNNVFT